MLLSLSTTLQGQADALPAMLDAVAPLQVRVLLTLGGVLPTASVKAPPYVIVRDAIPHDLVLPHMTTVISHGGLSTITAAPAGVPLLCIPQGRDQHFNAERVSTAGVGRVVAASASAAQIGSALAELMADPATRRAAGRFAENIAQLGGGDLATDKVSAPARPAP